MDYDNKNYQEFLRGFKESIKDLSDINKKEIADIFLRNISEAWSYRYSEDFPAGLYLTIDSDLINVEAYYLDWKRVFKDIDLELLWISNDEELVGFTIDSLANFITVDSSVDTKAVFEKIAAEYDLPKPEFWYNAGYNYGLEIKESSSNWSVDKDLLTLLDHLNYSREEYPINFEDCKEYINDFER